MEIRLIDGPAAGRTIAVALGARYLEMPEEEENDLRGLQYEIGRLATKVGDEVKVEWVGRLVKRRWWVKRGHGYWRWVAIKRMNNQ